MVDVIVVGAGPGGSSASTFLAQQGYDVLLLDRAKFPRDKPCGEYLSPGAYSILDRLGVWPAIEALKPHFLKGMIITSNQKAFQSDFPDKNSNQTYQKRGFGIRRVLLDHLLVQNAISHGVRLLENFVVTNLVIDHGKVVGVEGSSKEQIACRFDAKLVIGADGINSVVARKLQLDEPIPSLARVGLVAHYQGATGLTEYGEMHASTDCYCGVASLDGELANISIGVTQQLYRQRQGDADQLYDTLMNRFPMIKRRLTNAQRIGKVKPMGPLARRTRRATWDGAMLVGDAAGFIDPFTGEGMYLGLRSGELAAKTAVEALSENNVSRERLSQYDLDRQQELSHKYLLCMLIQSVLRHPKWMDFFVEKLAQKQEQRELLIGSTGDYISPDEILSPSYLMKLLF